MIYLSKFGSQRYTLHPSHTWLTANSDLSFLAKAYMPREGKKEATWTMHTGNNFWKWPDHALTQNEPVTSGMAIAHTCKYIFLQNQLPVKCETGFT